MLGFVSEGIRECGRKAARFRLRGRLKARGRERQVALATLGRSAWEAGVDLDRLRGMAGSAHQARRQVR